MPSSVARLIAADHERLLRLIRRACAQGPSQQRWRGELVQLMRAHQAAETDTLTAEVVGEAGPSTVPALQRLTELDDRLAASVSRLEAAGLDSPALDTAGTDLADAVTRHAELLTAGVLTPMTDALPRRQMRARGGRTAASRDTARREPGADEPPPRRLDVSRAELYELAKRAGIEGRSSMSRRDLILELQRRQQT